MDIQFCDTPLTRATGAIYSACDSFGLSEEESLAMFQLVLCGKDRLCVVSKRGLPPLFRKGMKSLMARGWVDETPKLYGLMSTPETEVIIRSAVQAIQFGESEGTA